MLANLEAGWQCVAVRTQIDPGRKVTIFRTCSDWQAAKHVFVQRREQAAPSTNSPTVWTAIAYASNLEDQHRFSLQRSYDR